MEKLCVLVPLRFKFSSSSSLGFVRNEIAGEDFDYAFRSSHDRCHVKPDVDRPRDQALFLDLVARQANRKDRSYNGNRFNEAFDYAPSTSPDNSAFNRSHLLFDRSIDARSLKRVLCSLCFVLGRYHSKSGPPETKYKALSSKSVLA